MQVLRRAMTVAVTMMLTMAGFGVASSAASTTSTRLYLTEYTISLVGPKAPAHNCDTFGWDCGYVAVTATFGGLNRLSTRPQFVEGAMHARLMGTVQVSRTYGCQSATGFRRHGFDRTVTESVRLDNRRGIGFAIPPDGDTVGSVTFGYFPDRQPGNCPAGTTAMTYRIVAKQTRLELNSYVDQIASHTYGAPGRGQWIGAVPTPDPILTP